MHGYQLNIKKLFTYKISYNWIGSNIDGYEMGVFK